MEHASTLKARILTGGTKDHTKLINRDVPDQHPISAITGLETALSDLRDSMEDLDGAKADGIVYDSEDNTLQLTSGGEPIGSAVVLDIDIGRLLGITNVRLDEYGNLVFIISDDEDELNETYGPGGIVILLSDYVANLTIPSEAINTDSDVISDKLKLTRTALNRGIPVFTPASIDGELRLLRLYSVTTAVDGVFRIQYSDILVDKVRLTPCLEVTSSIVGGETVYETITGILADNYANYDDVSDVNVTAALNTLVPMGAIGDSTDILDNPNLGTTLDALSMLGVLTQWGLWKNNYYESFSDLPEGENEEDSDFQAVIRRLVSKGVFDPEPGSGLDVEDTILNLDRNSLRVLTYLANWGIWTNIYYRMYTDLPSSEDADYRAAIYELFRRGVLYGVDNVNTPESVDDAVLNLDRNSVRVITFMYRWGLLGNPYYHTYGDLPTGTEAGTTYGTEARDVIHKLVDRGIIMGTGSTPIDPSSNIDDLQLDFDKNTIRTLVILDRLGILDYNYTSSVTPGGSDNSSSSGTDTGTRFAVNTVVYFGGTKHYTASNGSTWYTTTPGSAKVIRRNPGSKHPYNLVYTDGSTSGVYGWVNAEDVYESEAAYIAANGS